ncbi:MAG: 2-oxoacid:acceptor oxidoreductase family protein [Gammaproteobacteria bacterium]|nr:2-oxoacid:acceptor oxidoreductase family protein [Gammaproteobacteria bacterium]
MNSMARIEVRFGGTGGQGLILAGTLLAEACAAAGRHIAQSQTYEPTSRGGYCNCDLVVADSEVDYPLATALDQLVLLDRMAVAPSWPLLKPNALIIADLRLCPQLPEGGGRVHHLPLSRSAIELGSERVANIVALGALAALAGGCERAAIEQAVRAHTPRNYRDLNLDALATGYRLATGAAAAAAAAGTPAHGVTARAQSAACPSRR